MNIIKANIEAFRGHLKSLNEKKGTPQNRQRIVYVTKGQPIERVVQLYSYLKSQGEDQIEFGENYLEGLEERIAYFQKNKINDVRWSFLGRLQSRKVKRLVEICDSLHGVSRLSEIIEICTQAALVRTNKGPIKIFLQVHITSADNKGGFDPVEVKEAVEYFLSQKPSGVDLVGLMGIADEIDNVGEQVVRGQFDRLREIRDEILPNGKLSMGMSGDYSIAVNCGADFLRVGSLIMGPRA